MGAPMGAPWGPKGVPMGPHGTPWDPGRPAGRGPQGPGRAGPWAPEAAGRQPTNLWDGGVWGGGAPPGYLRGVWRGTAPPQLWRSVDWWSLLNTLQVSGGGGE